MNINNFDEEKNKEEAKLNSYNELYIEYIKNEIQDNLAFKTFFKNLTILSFKNNEVVIYFPKVHPNLSSFKNYYKNVFDKSVKEIFGANVAYRIIDKETLDALKETEKQSKNLNIHIPTTNKKKTDGIEYTFHNYIHGSFNDEALNICKSIIDDEYKLEVLFITGNSGLGKTHLLKAISNALNKEGKSSFLVNATEFIRWIQPLLKENSVDVLNKFQKKLIDNYDILMFDDFQLYGSGNKKATKDYIFQVLDSRMEKGKLTIFCSDTDINGISKIFDERLVSRIQSGFITKIKQPEQEDLHKILDFLLTENNFDINTLDDESKDFIIRNHSNSIRTLTGAVKRLSFYEKEIKSLPKTLVIKTIKNIFGDFIKDKAEITDEIILKAVSEYYKIPVKDILSTSRKSNIFLARQIAIYMIKKHLDYSSNELGKLFKRDHSTILSALKKINTKDDIKVKKVINEVEDKMRKNY
ncbi:DnaA ATPase domain-containing protein [Mycoplasma sp. 2248]|uniref:DnaA ATPase domain-containing protein n=1 Tax=Mycoplasma sp. 2248 TaxID=3108528 RepID=UPI002B1E62FC|nr:DnaA/Hda family protein [Mycoplasma sp. 2248]MEA4191208.1 DnaA/Hda family protein [Mycoplasma sp. 2248]